VAKKETCKHKQTHTEFVSGSHHKYEIKVCDKCDKVVKTKITK
jgi:NAD-dependent SIR2 family protein deacetylase